MLKVNMHGVCQNDKKNNFSQNHNDKSDASNEFIPSNFSDDPANNSIQ